MKFLSFKPPESHTRLRRICDISNDPTVIHEIWKQFSEGTVVHRGVDDHHPFVLLAKEADMRTADIRHASLVKSASINQS